MEIAGRLALGLGILALAACAASPAEPADEALLKWADQQGYKRVDQDGKTFYCRMPLATGSHLQKPDCVTKEVLTERKHQGDFKNVNARSVPR
ncbi:MAG TPA: hypothetical protein VMT92_08380 [Steroidobacteraceae bacterium]|nr:hypothetical protein [Steroidobacteraceae bacterium]